MNKINVSNSNLTIPDIGIGCMRIAEMDSKKLEELIQTAIELDLNFFDHADIYGAGKSEEVFAEAIASQNIDRESIILQSKCGIRKGFYDLSEEHIINSVDKILMRLKTEYLDILLLHRPDALVEPEEVAAAFDILERTGKVKHFGVSNHNPMQIELLKKHVKQPILFNQLQLSAMRTGMIDQGINVNMKVPGSLDHDGSVLDYCRLKDITIQAWSPFQYGFFEGVFLDNKKFPELNRVIKKLAEKYDVQDSAVAVAWILRHPARIQTIIGTTKVERLKQISEASDIVMSREDWYEVYRAAGNELP